MNKFKVGQRVKIKVTGKQGKILDIAGDVDIDSYGSSKINYYVSFENNGLFRRMFFTVHDLEEVKDILDKEEKEYLSNVIKPFKNKVESIKKLEYEGNRQKEFIMISIENDYPINLPNFKQNTMYKNMGINKEYTLEELGL